LKTKLISNSQKQSNPKILPQSIPPLPAWVKGGSPKNFQKNPISVNRIRKTGSIDQKLIQKTKSTPKIDSMAQLE
jgi:hypothetical protein